MKFTFLGTGAAERYPGLWCTCRYCMKARKEGGRNIRRNSSAYFAKDCLIDFPAEGYSQAERFGIDLLSAKLLLVTHSHEDHFYPQSLLWRYRPKEAEKMSEEERFEQGYSRQQELPLLHIFGNQCTYDEMIRVFGEESLEEFAIRFTVPEPYQEYECSGVRFIPMVAAHTDRGSAKGLIYAVIMEQTFGYAKKGDSHMDWDRAEEAMRFFEEARVWKQEPRIYWTHMSPHRTPPHCELEELLRDTPIIPAYDGMQIEI